LSLFSLIFFVSTPAPSTEIYTLSLHDALPIWGNKGLSTGDAANDLFPLALDPNVHIQEVKASTCDIRPGRRPRGPALLGLVEDYRRRAGVDTDQPREQAHEGAGSA